MDDFERASSIVPSTMDVRPWILYDRVDLARGKHTDKLELFVEPIGPLRGFESTNMRMRMMLPAPQQFLVQAVYCLYSTRGQPEFQEATWHLVIGTKGFGRSPLCFIALPGNLQAKEGLYLRSEPEHAPGEIDSEKWATHATMWPVDRQGLVTIPPLGMFFLEITGSLSCDEPLTLWFCLEGLLARGVQ